MEDAKIIELYLSRSETAIRETENKYSSFLYRRYMAFCGIIAIRRKS